MLHARQASAVADRLIQRITRCRSAEAFAVACAEALDAVFIEQCFGGGQQREAVDAPGRPLIGRVEGADAFDFVTKEIEPQSLGFAGWIQVDQSTANGEFTSIRNRFHADIAIGLQQCREAVSTDPLFGGKPRNELTNAEWRQRPLGERVDGCHQQLRPARLLLQPVQRCHPFGHHAQRRGRAVVRQAIPRREGQHLQLGCEGLRGGRDRTHRGFVGRDEYRACLCGARQVGKQPRFEPGRHTR